MAMQKLDKLQYSDLLKIKTPVGELVYGPGFNPCIDCLRFPTKELAVREMLITHEDRLAKNYAGVLLVEDGNNKREEACWWVALNSTHNHTLFDGKVYPFKIAPILPKKQEVLEDCIAKIVFSERRFHYDDYVDAQIRAHIMQGLIKYNPLINQIHSS
ncbi:MAG: hypothetical protein QXT19_02350 [Candidatus Woesearchaeota archaeon]